MVKFDCLIPKGSGLLRKKWDRSGMTCLEKVKSEKQDLHRQGLHSHGLDISGWLQL